MPAYSLDNCGNNLKRPLGSVRLLIDASGNVENHYTYDPFGQTFAGQTQQNVTNPYQFTGQWFDAEINQYYLRARMYDPVISRFTSRDPVSGKFENPLSLHKYLYCQNDPVNNWDPKGLVYTPFPWSHYDEVDTEYVIWYATNYVLKYGYTIAFCSNRL